VVLRIIGGDASESKQALIERARVYLVERGKRDLQSYWDDGKVYTVLREDIGHGDWGPWCRANIPQHPKMIQRSQSVYWKWPQGIPDGVTVKTGLALLVKDKTGNGHPPAGKRKAKEVPPAGSPEVPPAGSPDLKDTIKTAGEAVKTLLTETPSKLPDESANDLPEQDRLLERVQEIVANPDANPLPRIAKWEDKTQEGDPTVIDVLTAMHNTLENMIVHPELWGEECITPSVEAVLGSAQELLRKANIVYSGS
jgi:hypothetical protein